MSKFLIRNDDVAFDTQLEEIKRFCEICDRHGFQIIQSITPIGFGGRKARAVMTNEAIRLLSFNRFEENKEVLELLKKRKDLIGVHGLWHTHVPTDLEISKAKSLLEEIGLSPTYFVPPYNEGDYPEQVEGLTTCQLSIEKGERLEDFIKEGKPQAPIVYLHSWRFNNVYFTFDQLDQCLERLKTKIKRISNFPTNPIRLWYNDWVAQNAIGRVLDIGKSRHWDYGFETLDANAKLNPTYVSSIEKTEFEDETFDTVLCNGLYEFVNDPQKMIDEAIRITKKGGTVLFGFVGADYKPFLPNWKYFEGKEKLPPHTRKDFGKEYHFLICKKP